MTDRPSVSERPAPDTEDPHRAEVLQLRAQVAALEARLALEKARAQPDPGSASSARRADRIRWTSAIIVILLGALIAIPAVTGLWAKRTLLDSDRYVATIAPLAAEPGVQDLVSKRITAAIFQYVDVDTLTQQALSTLAANGAPSAVTGLAIPISSEIRSFVSGEVDDLVRSQAFQTAWVQANRIAHDQAVAVLLGENGAITATKSGLSVNLGPFLERIKSDLVDRGFPLASRIPAVNLRVQVLRGVDVATLTNGVTALDRAGTWLPWLAIVVLVGGVLLAPRRRSAAYIAGSALAGAMVLLVIGIAAGRIWLGDKMSDAAIPTATGQAIAGDLTQFLRASARTTFALGLLVVLIAWFTGTSPGAERLRRGMTTLTYRVRSELTGSAEPSRTEQWLAGHQLLVDGIVIAAAAAVVLSWSTVPAGRLIALVVGVLVIVAVVRALGRTDERTRPRSG